MQHLTTAVHPEVEELQGTQFTRFATRAIIIRDDKILMLYTARYDDYSLPGGGIDEGEDPVDALIREVEEETGARNVRDVEPYGIYEEYRPWYKPDYDIMHMVSYCYRCTIDAKLGQTRYEDYEAKNGMEPVWISIHDAIAHNEHVLAHSEKKGMSVERETYLLKRLLEESSELQV